MPMHLEREWYYTTAGNGTFVTIHGPDGRAAFLQGDSAAGFMERAEQTNERYTDADLCREYGEAMERFWTVWIVKHGECEFRFYTEHHADQYAAALDRNGTAYTRSCRKEPRHTGRVHAASWHKGL